MIYIIKNDPKHGWVTTSRESKDWDYDEKRYLITFDNPHEAFIAAQERHPEDEVRILIPEDDKSHPQVEWHYFSPEVLIDWMKLLE